MLTMETYTEEKKERNNKQETPLQQLGNKGCNIDCILSFSGNKEAVDQDHNTQMRSKDLLKYATETEHIPTCNRLSHSVSKVDAATMTEVVSESYFEQETTSRSPLYEVTAMIPATSTWHSFSGAPDSTMIEYLSRLTASALPLTLHNFLKFSAAPNEESNLPIANKLLKEDNINNEPKRKNKQCSLSPTLQVKGNEIHLTTALDGSTLFCCPECHMAYPERELLQQHLVMHQLERRYVCDICGAGLKRKEHLDRHKQGHSPDRPYACSICLKAFKRNEHLSRHFITHSGDKSQICIECGKSFYRKDHLHKHAQSHIAKRLRTEFCSKRQDVNTSFLTSNEEDSSVTLRSDPTPLPILSS